MKTAILLGIAGLLLTIGGAAIGYNHSHIVRVEGYVERQLGRVEDKIDSQIFRMQSLAVAIGRIEGKIDKNGK